MHNNSDLLTAVNMYNMKFKIARRIRISDVLDRFPYNMVLLHTIIM